MENERLYIIKGKIILKYLLTYLILTTGITFLAACKGHNENKPQIIKHKDSISASLQSSYIEVKYNIKSRRIALSKKYKHPLSPSDISALQKDFTSMVVDSIFPYWYGTPWDFNGTTQKPGEGSIACGYFITTILQDAGLPIQRVKLAQCASQQIIADVVRKNHKKIFSNATMDKFLSYIKEQGYGLYIVGLDFHVGFLYNDGNEIHFIHAKWINPKAVVKEVASVSGVLEHSAYKIVGKISDDELFLDRWLHGK